jgi:hypothetical protein
MLLINRNFKVDYIINEEQIINQTETLLNLLKKAKNTSFGKEHKFEAILRSNDILDSFQKDIPLTNYENFYEPWISKTLNGENNVVWPDKINYFALSSGTTNETSKKLPVSKDMLKCFFKQTRKQAIGINKMNFPKSFYTTSCLTLGGSTQLKKDGDVYLGDLSGILQKNTPFFYRPFKKPGKKVSALNDWDEKLKAIIKKAPKWNIGTIAGVPNWILFVLEGVIDHYGLKNIHEIWPNFRLCLHGGIELGVYKERILSLCGESIQFLNTYLASEGYFAFQTVRDSNEMKLLTKNGVYYEFIEKKHFKSIQENNLKVPTIGWSEVEKDIEYGLVITTNSGLWRYIIGDTISFSNNELSCIRFHGRIQQTMSAMGEHLSLANLTKAIENSSKLLNADFAEFCLYFDSKKNLHRWYIGSSSYIQPDEVSQVLDLQLKSLNDDYRQLRKYVLNEPDIKILPIAKFYEFLGNQKKLGGQNKFPRVLNDDQLKEWKRFLSS